ncbi:hypothetical protein COZ39_01515 [Candidatus Roizmanbacteria bacterium CG_4_10_14_3_um_filter_33_21]|uniref:GrpB family protein n=3 Tax=Candidatus Roizmaniibacteriota TaxID=1752723 RepID=A0A2M7M0H7_9BACT|nr:MAG: hypothetical protein COZ39_01515 [Candidatus Roizmanbacteria bacterium CG_4_10_14_3_um_filter_33_21]
MSVTLHLYNKDFPLLFEKEKLRITSVLKNIDIHHVGSSAVSGLFGKNIVDILIGLENFEKEVEEIASKIIQLGYKYRFNVKEKKWAYLKNKTTSSKCYFHIHLVQKNSKDYQDWFLFRDYLRKYQKERNKYAKLKPIWLKKSKGIGLVYAGLKTKYVQSVLEKARKDGQ